MKAPLQDREKRCVLFDWGDTVMRVFPQFDGPMARWPRVEIMEGMRDALGRIAAFARIGLATNAADSDEIEIRAALDRVGLDPLFDHVFCARTVGHRKPSRAFFHEVLRQLDLPATSVILVGDDLDTDVRGAQAGGLHALWLPSTSSASGAKDDLGTTAAQVAEQALDLFGLAARRT